MTDIMDLSTQELLTVLTVVSKACEFKDTIGGALVVNHQEFEAAQFTSAAVEAEKVLGRLDAAYPGLLPVPHDGRSWSERLSGKG